MGLRALNEQQEVSMNWKEKLRKECEHLNEVSDFYSFSVMQIQQDKEYFVDNQANYHKCKKEAAPN